MAANYIFLTLEAHNTADSQFIPAFIWLSANKFVPLHRFPRNRCQRRVA